MATTNVKPAPDAAPELPGRPGRDDPAQEIATTPITRMEKWEGEIVDAPFVVLDIIRANPTGIVMIHDAFLQVRDSVSFSGFVGLWAPMNGRHAASQTGGVDTITVPIDSLTFGAPPDPASISATAEIPIPHVRCYLAPADAARLTEEQDVTFTITAGGPVPEIDGQSIPVEVLRADNFSITRAMLAYDATAMAAMRATIDYLPGVAGGGAGVGISQYVPVFVHHRGIALVGKQTGYCTVTKADAAELIAAGHAINAYQLSFAGPYISDSDPWPPVAP